MDRRFTRREVLIGLATAAAAAGVSACTRRTHHAGGASANGHGSASGTLFRAADVHRTAELHQAAFEPHVGSTFGVRVSTLTSVDLRLDAVTPLQVPAGSKSPVKGGEGFSLAFSGPPSAVPQGSYPVQHAEMGRFELFLVPVGLGGGDYQAVFNRLWR